jgi:hypothetical protein
MIWIRASKAGGVMTGSTLGVWVMGKVGIIRTYGDVAIVATSAFPDDTFMVETTVRIQVQEMISVVARVAFFIGLDMEFRFSDCHDIVMATTTGSEYLIMIDIVDLIKVGRGMTCLT